MQVYGAGTMAETTEGESTPRTVAPAPDGGRNPVYSNRATAPSRVHSSPPGRDSHKGTSDHGKSLPLLLKGGLRICCMDPPEFHGSNPRAD